MIPILVPLLFRCVAGACTSCLKSDVRSVRRKKEGGEETRAVRAPVAGGHGRRASPSHGGAVQHREKGGRAPAPKSCLGAVCF